LHTLRGVRKNSRPKKRGWNFFIRRGIGNPKKIRSVCLHLGSRGGKKECQDGRRLRRQEKILMESRIAILRGGRGGIGGKIGIVTGWGGT